MSDGKRKMAEKTTAKDILEVLSFDQSQKYQRTWCIIGLNCDLVNDKNIKF